MRSIAMMKRASLPFPWTRIRLDHTQFVHLFRWREDRRGDARAQHGEDDGQRRAVDTGADGPELQPDEAQDHGDGRLEVLELRAARASTPCTPAAPE